MKKILLSLSLILLGYASFSQQDIKSRWIVNINGFRFTLHNAGDSIFKVKTDSVLFGKPTNLPFVSQSTLNDSAASIRSAITDSTVYTSYPIRSRVSGDSIILYMDEGFMDSVRVSYPKYKSYVANISQTGTNAPVENIVYYNDCGSVSWSYSATGSYNLTFTDSFDDTKATTIQASSFGGGFGSTVYYLEGSATSSTTYRVRTSTLLGVASDDAITNYTIEIRIYY